jgi:hypothetical protein
MSRVPDYQLYAWASQWCEQPIEGLGEYRGKILS